VLNAPAAPGREKYEGMKMGADRRPVTSRCLRGRAQVLLLSLALFGIAGPVRAQHSVARQWNEVLIAAIRQDLARPTVHARNLFHTSIAMYDAWAVYDTLAQTYFLGKTVGGFTCPFAGIAPPVDLHAAREQAISYATYRFLTHRFSKSPGAVQSLHRFDSLMIRLGYDTSFASTDYSNGSPAALGNYLGQQLIAYGLQDGANEANGYANTHYTPVNPPLAPILPGDSSLIDPNRWQPLTLKVIIDQAGNVIPGDTTKFLSPEWGQVTPFALKASDKITYNRGGFDYQVYHDPGPPAYIDTLDPEGVLTQAYKWAFSLVAVWSGQLDATDTTMWDISPASIGNVQDLPQTLTDLKNFYKLQEGGDIGTGRTLNPRTGQPYQPQYVPRGDYTRVLAEFWADGPTSETPPGHWFTILNYVDDHPLFQKRFRGQGPVLEDLEWDVKSYFALGGAVHDAAIVAWGIKGWYDYVRPISAIRWMADHGQCSDTSLPSYSPAGIPLVPGYIELVQHGDSLAGVNDVNVGKIKLHAWRGPDSTKNPRTDVIGVGWILAKRWWPYQRPTFVTPPFAGYVSGHSTYSRAASELMTLLTGDEYFPGGMGEFLAPRNEFLVFEDGPSVDVMLQWATYRDASDQCSLSRIWGGIHPPIDDMPGRILGKTVGIDAFQHAELYFNGQITGVKEAPSNSGKHPVPWTLLYPNPVSAGKSVTVQFNLPATDVVLNLYNILGQTVHTRTLPSVGVRQAITLNTSALASGTYMLRVTGKNRISTDRIYIVR
jgi:hypothetical protein